MNDIRTLLKRGDPIGAESNPSAADVERMRRIVIATQAAQPLRYWPSTVFVTATVAGAIAASVAIGRQLPLRDAAPQRSQGAAGVEDSVPTRQLQFETAGGTRIIWVFDPNFKL